ncbi:nucleoside triphosphate pyrophosphohydrolase, partial [Yersinia enterocolitica]
MTQSVTSPGTTALALQRLLDIMRTLRDPEH